jgi:hypothetical protein
VRYADLAAHFALLGDPAARAVTFRDELLHPSSAPGLGVTLD